MNAIRLYIYIIFYYVIHSQCAVAPPIAYCPTPNRQCLRFIIGDNRMSPVSLLLLLILYKNICRSLH